MKKALILTGGSIVILIILNESGVLDSLLSFLLVGAIPGTSYSVPSTLMLLILVSSIWAVVVRLTTIEWLRAYIRKPSPASPELKDTTPETPL